MFYEIRRVFTRFRIFLSALRTGIYGFALVCATWVFAAPPSDLERDRLSLSSAETTPTEALRMHRMSKLLTLVGTDRIYQMVADRSGTGLTAQQVRLNVIAAAEGITVDQASANVSINAETPSVAASGQYTNETTDLDIDQIQKNSLRAGGAKFVSAPSN